MRRAAILVGLGLGLALVACKQKEPSRGSIDLTTRDAAEAVDGPVAAADAAAAPKLTAIQLVAAGHQACALLSDHTVRCWVDDAPATQPDVRAALQLAISDDRVCARLDDKSVACWSAAEPHPTGLLGVTGVDRVFALVGRACAARSTGSLVCWGNVDLGGHFSAAARRRQPTPFAGVDHVVALLPSAALREDGTVWSWDESGVPRQRGLEHVVELAAAPGGAICGRLETGAVACVGSTLPCAPKPTELKPEPTRAPIKAPAKTKKQAPAKTTAKVGKRAVPPRSPTVVAPPVKPAVPVEPVLTLELPRAKALAFDLGLCVITAAGRLQCGDGCDALEPPWKLAAIDALAGWCALARGHVSCWTAPRKITEVPGLDDVTAIAAGDDHACALRRDGTVACWSRPTVPGPITPSPVDFDAR